MYLEKEGGFQSSENNSYQTPGTYSNGALLANS